MKRWALFWKAVDQARTVPRIALGFYGLLMWKSYTWATSLPDISPSQSAFLMVIFGASAPILQFYMANGPRPVTETATKE